MTYDADGNQLTETHHFACANATSCTPGTTVRWYDAADRLVEVAMPQDPSDIFSHWLTRYDYDLGDSSSGVYGNLAAVQRYLPGPTQGGTTVSTAYQWITTQSWLYDGLDRAGSRSYYSPAATNMSTDRWYYDSAGAGLLASFVNAMGDNVSYAYDCLGQVIQRSFSANYTGNLYNGSLPSEHLSYFPNGQLASYDNEETGTAFYTYDANHDDQLQTYTEPNAVTAWSRPGALGAAGPISLAATKYWYYYCGDGSLQEVTADNKAYVEDYSYRTDGQLHRHIPALEDHQRGGRRAQQQDSVDQIPGARIQK